MAPTRCLSLLTLFSFLSLVSSQYDSHSPDQHFFINCGSNSVINFKGKNFVGDVNPSSFSLSDSDATVKNNNLPSNTPPIYQTARVFKKKSWYQLQPDGNNTFVMVRLHFFTMSSDEIKFSKFQVSISGFSLLSNFSVGNTTVIKEFIIPIGSERSFRIEFTPSDSSSSAFVNAMEAFTTPSDLFTTGVGLTHVTPTGTDVHLANITSSYAFNRIHGINDGGEMIDVTRDNLRRNWEPDDSFIFNSEPARNRTASDGQIKYQEGGATSFHAPYDVYKTAKQFNTNSSRPIDLVNITWNFGVNKKAMYLVRAHFCDIISTSFFDNSDGFYFFIYSHYNEKIQPIIKGYGVPFFIDLVVDSDESGFMSISISRIPDNHQMAFLNGIEIMELLKNSSAIDPLSDGKQNKSTVYIVVGCVAFVLILLAGFFIWLKHGKLNLNIDSTIEHSSRIPNLNLNLRVPYGDILQATCGFDEKLMIGKGGFGKVYKGTLANGRKVAVKRGEKGHGQGQAEFVREIMVLSRIRHRHLVSLIGYCDEKSEMILVYEFMEKGTLQDHLYNNANKDHPKLSWNKRLEICISAAQGLHYLHTGADEGIIHRDVKSTNILLDQHYVAKVADFGISRFNNVDPSETSDIKGSFGYMDPEYLSCMKLTEKSDVYSFGVVLLEVLCARPALDTKLPENEVNLANWAIKHIQNGTVDAIVDPFLAGTINTNSLRKFLETVEGSLKVTGDERPSMNNVIWDLKYALSFQQMAVDREPHEDSTMNTSLQLSMAMIHRLPSYGNDDSQVNDGSASSYPSGSMAIFSQLKIDEAR